MGKGRKATIGVGTMTGLALLLPISRGVTFDFVTDTVIGSEATAQEKVIEDAIHNAYGADIRVRCLGQDDITMRLWPVGRSLDTIYGYAVPLLSRIWLDQDVCDKAAGFAASQEKELTNGDTIHALGVVAHEAAHHVNWTFDEGVAQCEAIQMVDKLSLAMGSTPKVAYEIRERLGRMILKDMEKVTPTTGQLRPPQEYDLVECYDEGPHDLDLGKPGLFPQTK